MNGFFTFKLFFKEIITFQSVPKEMINSESFFKKINDFRVFLNRDEQTAR